MGKAVTTRAKRSGAELWAKSKNLLSAVKKVSAAAKDKAVKGVTSIKDAGVKALKERRKGVQTDVDENENDNDDVKDNEKDDEKASLEDNLEKLRKALMAECEAEKVTVYVKGVDEVPSELKKLVSEVNESGACERRKGLTTGGGYVDFGLSRRAVEGLENVAFYNAVKFVRYRYLTKESDDIEIEMKLCLDLLLTTILCVVLDVFGKGKLAFGTLVDQLVSTALYWKYRNPDVLFLPCYIPFV